MEIKFKRKVSKLAGVLAISIPKEMRRSIGNKMYKVSLGNISFIRQPSNLGGIKGFSIPSKMRGSVDLNRTYDIVLERGTITI